MKIIPGLIIICLLAVIGFFSLKDYRSAFEADQACHYEKLLLDKNIGVTDCDHDLETRQWLLYQKQSENKPAEVIKRYKY